MWAFAIALHWPQWFILSLWAILLTSAFADPHMKKWRIARIVFAAIYLWVLFKGGFFTGGVPQ